MTRSKTLLATALLVLGCAIARPAWGDGNWPAWRGPAASGHAQDDRLPIRWTPDSVVWKAPLPGRGQSTPIVWGDRIFLTTAVGEGQQRIVLCIRASDGAHLWQQVAWTGEPEETHEMNGWASASCATDGERVFAFFGRAGGLHCYSVEGEHQWSRELGQFETPWGTAASPLIVREMVIQNCDSDAGAYLIALDKNTGEQTWKTERPDFRGWSTPILIQAGGREEIVLNGHAGVAAYDPETGRQLWICRSERGRGSPTATPANGRLFVISGLSGGSVYCVQPGGEGDITETMRLWATQRGGRDLSSPIVLGNTVLATGLRSSVLTAYDAQTGRELWVKRLGGQISASPIAIGGRALFIDDTGKTRVIDPHAAEPVVETNELGAAPDEQFRASIVPCRGCLFIRSNRFLYCVQDQIEAR